MGLIVGMVSPPTYLPAATRLGAVHGVDDRVACIKCLKPFIRHDGPEVVGGQQHTSRGGPLHRYPRLRLPLCGDHG